MGCCTVFFDVAYQSYLPDIVEPEHIGEGNAKLQAVQSVAMIGGPAIARRADQADRCAADHRARRAELRRGRRSSSAASSTSTPRPRARTVDRCVVEVREGLSFVLKHPLLWRITACTSLSQPLQLDVRRDARALRASDLGPRRGTARARLRASARSAACSAPSWSPRVDRAGSARAASSRSRRSSGCRPRVPDAAGRDRDRPDGRRRSATCCCSTFGVVLYNVTQVSFRQRLCPRPMLGRMNASIRFLVWGVMPIGGFLGGVIGHQFGARGRCSGSRPSARSWPRCRCCSPRCSAMRDLPRELDQLS